MKCEHTAEDTHPFPSNHNKTNHYHYHTRILGRLLQKFALFNCWTGVIITCNTIHTPRNQDPGWLLEATSTWFVNCNPYAPNLGLPSAVVFKWYHPASQTKETFQGTPSSFSGYTSCYALEHANLNSRARKSNTRSGMEKIFILAANFGSSIGDS